MMAAATISPSPPFGESALEPTPSLTTLGAGAGRDRHCAFCLNPINALRILLCGNCRRRAYCSKQCQERDWKIKDSDEPTQEQRGQGHVNWCGLAAGEEDLDWKVVEVKGKGLGLVALRDIPAGCRIMVEAAQRSPFAHPKTSDLTPLSLSLSSKEVEGKLRPATATEHELRIKYYLNTVGCGDADPEYFVLCLRMARLNHACFPNADHFYDAERGVKILYSVRDILKDEEITISYINFTSFTDRELTGVNLKQRHERLRAGWGVECSNRSLCRVTSVRQRIVEAGRLYFLQVLGRGWPEKTMDTLTAGLEGVRKLIGVCDDLKLSQREKAAVLRSGLVLASAQEETWEEARFLAAELIRVLEPICHPKDARFQNFLDWKAWVEGKLQGQVEGKWD